MRIVVVSGPPCAGKSTYVGEHADPDRDVVIDFDALAHALGYPLPHVQWPADRHPARTVALRARASVLRALRDLRDVDGTAWIVQAGHTPPSAFEDADRVVLDPGVDECLRRAGHRPDVESERREITEWYATAATPSRPW